MKIWSCKAPFFISKMKEGEVIKSVKVITVCIGIVTAILIILQFDILVTDQVSYEENQAVYTAKPYGQKEEKENIQENVNSDICSWITIQGTNIDYPVCQGTDNEYYLTHDVNGNKNIYGAIFLDYQSNQEDVNKVIYGHNMGSGSDEMFSSLISYENTEWYSEHRIIQYVDNGDKQAYKIFAVMNFDINNLSEFDYMQRNFDSQTFEEWLLYIKKHSLYNYDVDVKYGDELITLSTCNRKLGEDNRLVVFSVKERGEDEGK